MRALALTAAAAACAVATVASVAAGPAEAAVVSGWTGPAGSTGYLHNSTIINAPALTAESKIWQVVGSSAAAGTIGARARLFKSGALCEAVDYEYNPYSATEWAVRTTNTCGTGSYNSHGFVAVWNASTNTYGEYLTFPSNPLNWTAPAARNAQATAQITDAQRQSGVNSRGQRYGSADTGDNKESQLDLVLAIGTNNKVGYVRATQLDEQKTPSNPAEAARQNSPARSIPLLDKDGTTQIGTFTVR